MAKYAFDFSVQFDDGDYEEVKCEITGKDNFISALYSGLNAVTQHEGANKDNGHEAHRQFWDIVESARESGRQVSELTVTITEEPSTGLVKHY
ncbi:MAG: hypothetical protein ACWGQW_00265 [bacterium]